MTTTKGLAEGQVLQRLGSRGATVEISGNVSKAGISISATISGAKGALKGWKSKLVGKSAREGLFVAKLAGIPVGGPYRLELQAGKEKVKVSQFFVGDVWLLAGQSNMEGVGNMTAPAKPHPLIRAYSMRHEWRLATDPLHIILESPDKCHNGGVQRSRVETEKMRHSSTKGVGPGIFFARKMMEESGVPQGLIATAHGGTSMAQWDPKGDEMYPSMLASWQATGQPVAGMLWYQGESDTGPNEAAIYMDRMKALVAASRSDLQQPKLPWVIVQISRVCTDETGPGWNRIQELQRLLPEKIPNFETVSAIDLPLDDGIHISAQGYVVLGKRLARAMSRLVNGGKGMRPPQLLKIAELNSLQSPTIEVTFDSVAKELKSEGLPQGFTLVTPEGKPTLLIYKTTLHGNVARLHCGQIPPGLYLHYGFGRFPICNITDGRNMSLPVFGPISISKTTAMLPYIKEWKYSGLISTSEPLKKIACPDVDALGGTPKTYATHLEGFVDEHASWEGRQGHGYFSATLELEEPMKLCFLMGYDGPFRLWLDESPFFQDLKGTNPALPDSKKKSVALAAGQHRITIAMDINEGMAWGFFLRFIREDVTAAALKDFSYKKPAYST